MAYSMDPEENKRNPSSPSEHLSLSDQVMYKLAAMEATLHGGFRRLDEKMDRFQKDLQDNQIATNDRINTLDKEFAATISAKRARIDGLVKEGEIAKKEIEQRLINLETWRHVAIAKVSAILTAIGVVWVLVAPTIRDILGISNN